MLDRIRGFLRNRKKPALGTLAAAVLFAFLVSVVHLDEVTATGISLAVGAFVTERVGPIFGDDTESPTLDPDGKIAIKPDPRREIKLRGRHRR